MKNEPTTTVFELNPSALPQTDWSRFDAMTER